jgi:cytochrome b561
MTDTPTNAMFLSAPERRHDAVTQAIHWATLLAIVTAVVAGFVMEEMPKGPSKAQVVNLHASFGVLIMALTAFRLLWRSTVPAVAPLQRPYWLYVAAKIMQVALYVLLVAIPATGVLMMAAKGRSFEVFGLFSMAPLIATDRALGHSLEEVHEVLAYLMIGLVGLHTLAALLHQWVLRDGTLARMLPFGRTGRA